MSSLNNVEPIHDNESNQVIKIKSRIAPTPSGYLHPGNIFNFVLTWLEVRANNGMLHLRIDDADSQRVRREYVDDIFAVLDWLKLDFDSGPTDYQDFINNHSQILRKKHYQHTIELLQQQNLLFICGCSRLQLQNNPTHQKCLQGEFTGTSAFTLRLMTPELDQLTESQYTLLNQKIHETMPYPVVLKKDGFAAYDICSITDDTLMGINLIVRGADLQIQTLLQQKIAAVIGYHSFGEARFIHHPLLYDACGKKLSKSAGAQKQSILQSFTSVKTLLKHLPFDFKRKPPPADLLELLDYYQQYRAEVNDSLLKNTRS